MKLSRALAWLYEEPDRSFTFNGLLRTGWPGLASFFLLPMLLALGRAGRFVERVIFIGGMAGFVAFGGLRIPSLATKAGLIDAFELAVMVKAIALVAGFAVQIPLWIAGYLIGGFERVLPEFGRGQIDMKRYSPRKKPD
jgi:hypothetical protein